MLEDRLIKSSLIAILLICGTLSILTLPQVRGAEDLVKVGYTNYGGITVVEYKNNEDNIFDIASVVLEVDKGGSFKSFKTEKGWIGKKNSEDMITFTTTTPIKPGQSAKFGIKTDQPQPVFKWKAFDEDGDEVGSGGKIVTHPQQEITPGEEIKPKKPSGVLESSTFKLVPGAPKVGSSLRVIGEGFGVNEKLDFYIDNNRIDSFVTDENGAFILTTKIPESQRADRSDFIIKDQEGNQKTTSLRIQESSSRVEIEGVALTVSMDLVFHRGDQKTISGTADPGSTLTISLSDSNNQTLTTFTVKANSTGKYSVDHKIPIDRPFGQYFINITEGKSTVSHTYTVETTQKIILTPSKQKYDPGETVKVNGTALIDKELQIVIRDPVNMEVFSKNILVGNDGIVTFDYNTTSSIREGTYVIFAIQGDEHETFLFGIGEIPQAQLIARMSALNYKNSEQAIIYITGTPSSTLSLVVIDPSDKQKFSDTITIGADGFYQYSFNLNQYPPGVYTAVLSRGNAQIEEKFSVGLQTSTGPINMRTTADTFLSGEAILVLGDSKPNVIITITLKDPNGTKIKSEDVFTDKKGVFTSSSFRFPTNAQLGIWKLEASSGLNHVSKDLIVLAQASEGLTVRVDKSPPTYHGDDVITISGNGAGKSRTIMITIINSGETTVQKLSIIATGIGSYSTIWKVPVDLDAGTYTIKVTDGVNSAQTTFSLQ